MTIWFKADKDFLARKRGYLNYDDAVVNMYRDGLSTSQIADYFDMTTSAIGYRLKKLGVVMRGRGGRNNMIGRL